MVFAFSLNSSESSSPPRSALTSSSMLYSATVSSSAVSSSATTSSTVLLLQVGLLYFLLRLLSSFWLGRHWIGLLPARLTTSLTCLRVLPGVLQFGGIIIGLIIFWCWSTEIFIRPGLQMYPFFCMDLAPALTAVLDCFSVLLPFLVIFTTRHF